MPPKKKSRVQIALDYMSANPKETPYAAAKFAGVSDSVVYRAIAARKKPRCPHCGQPMPK